MANPLEINHEDAAILANFGLTDEAHNIEALLATTEMEKKKVEREDEEDNTKRERRSSRNSKKSSSSSSSQSSSTNETLTIGMPKTSASSSSSILTADEEAAMKNANSSPAPSSSSSTKKGSDSIAISVRSTVVDERTRESERKRERVVLEREADEQEQRKLLARQQDELRRQRERIEAEQYANYQSAKEKNLIPMDDSENTYLLRHDDAPAFGCWQGIVTGLCGRNSYPMQGINIVHKLFTP